MMNIVLFLISFGTD